jgi:uncharacterized protein
VTAVLRPGQRHLILFLKAPRPGTVKRRLGREIGAVEAWAFYRRNVAAMLARVGRDPRWTVRIAITPDQARGLSRTWPAARGVAITGQGTGDLGARMHRAMAEPPPGPVVLIGGDIPGIDRSAIARAFSALGRTDFVFGPAADGGFWLVGARRRPNFPDVFAGARWSTPHALSDTLANVDGRVAFVEERADVDDAAGWRRWRALSRRPDAP